MADAPDMHTTSQLPLVLGERGRGAMKKTTRTGGLGVDSRETILEQNGPFPGAETRTDAVSDSETDAPATPPLNELVQQELLDLAEHEGNLRSRLSAAAQTFFALSEQSTLCTTRALCRALQDFIF